MSNDLSTVVCQFTPAVQTEISNAVVAAYALAEITDAPTCEAAVAINARISKATKALSAERLEFTRKLDAVKARAMEYERAVAKDALECAEALDGSINEYRTKLREEALRREAIAKAQQDALAAAEKESGGEERMTAPLVAVEPMVEAPKIPVRKVAKVLVTDLSKIPRNFFTLNEREVLDSLKAGTVVPGAELVYEEVLVRR